MDMEKVLDVVLVCIMVPVFLLISTYSILLLIMACQGIMRLL